MNAQIENVLKAFAHEVYTLAQGVFQQYGLQGTALATDFEEPTITFDGDSVVMQLLFNHYIAYLENGRKPRTGKQPPTEALIGWARKKGIPTDNSTLYLIARAIWRDGFAARPILATLEEKMHHAFENKWADELADAITAEVAVYFE